MSLLSDQKTTVIYKGVEINLPLYLDHQSTTPLAPEVRDVFLNMIDNPGNAASTTHLFGLNAKEKIETAKKQVADLICAEPDEIIFTSGATEANNLALLGYARNFPDKGHIISLRIEHSSVLAPLKQLEAEGFRITYLPVEKNGRLLFENLEKAITSDTILISIQAANSEIGTMQDLRKISALCNSRNIPFHTDAVQALATEQIDVQRNNITFLSLSGHKLYGLQGIGALFVKRGTPLSPVLFGGDQQSTVRSGTQPTALIASLGEACRLVMEQRTNDTKHLFGLSSQLANNLKSELGENILINGPPENRIPGCLNFTLKNIEAEDLLLEMPTLALSTGSACTSASGSPSHVLLAIGLSATEASRTIRIGLGRYVTEIEVEYAANLIIQTYNKMIA